MTFLASRVTKTIPIPFEPGAEATIQKLSGRHLHRAIREQGAQMTEEIRARGGAQVVKEMQDAFSKVDAGDAAATKQLKEAQADPLRSYDKHSLIKSGLKSWTLPDPVTADLVEDFDDEAVEYFATEILKLSKPKLFQTVEEQEVEQKNG